MAETSKGGILAKAQKRLTRTKTKVLQNLGRAERTQDGEFDECVVRIEKQQEVAHRIQKELKNYIHCIKALSFASRSFYSAVTESYEQGWTKEPEFKHKVQSIDLLWADYLQKLQDRSMEPLNAYLMSFPTLKARVNKRGRKQVDYDNARHNLEVHQNAKKRDDQKIMKAQEDLNEAKKIYEDLNNDLHTELPDFYNSRVTFYGDLYQNLFGAENIFHQEVARVSEDVGDISNQLSKDFSHFVYQPKRPLSKSFSEGLEEHAPSVQQHRTGDIHDMSVSQAPSLSASNTPAKMNGERIENDVKHAQDNIYSNQDAIAQMDEDNSDSEPEKKEIEVRREQPVKDEPEVKVNGDIDGHSDDSGEDRGRGEPESTTGVPDYPPPQPPAEEPKVNGTKEDSDEITEDRLYDEPKPLERTAEKKAAENSVKENGTDVTDYQTPSNKPLKDPPPNVLYVVQSTHPYQSEDVDELSFDAGEMIYVLDYDNPEEQDDGWLMGMKQCDRTRGVFPENFTRKLGQDG